MTEPLVGRAAISFLVERSTEHDDGASSHWRMMHEDFDFREGRILSAKGFGGFTRAPGLATRLAHRLFQARYRRSAKSLACFARLDALARHLTAAQDRAYDLDVLRQAITLAALECHLPAGQMADAVILVIGDGFGTFSGLALSAHPGARVVLVNLTKTLLADLAILEAGGMRDFALAYDAATFDAALSDPSIRLIAVRADDHALVRRAPIDVAVNIASMQEMNPPTVAAYFDDLRACARMRPLMFYCCNREEKILPDGTKTIFRQYPWLDEDEIIFDELCPWHQTYYAFRPPFYRSYDGPHRHRLAVLHGGG